MKKVILFLLMTIFAGLAAHAQKANDNKAVAQAVEKLRMAMIEGNREKLAEMASEDLSYGHSGGHVETKAEFIEKIASGKSDFVTIDLTDQTIKTTGDVATVRHNLAGTTNNDGVPGTVNIHILTVWIKQKGNWKMLARQAVKSAH